MFEANELSRNVELQLNKDYPHSESAEFVVIRDEVLKEFAEIEKALIRRKDLVLTLGKAIEIHGKGVKREDICKAIKFYLRDAIAKELISERDITRYCPEEWKNETKPKKKDNLSFSVEEPERVIAVTTEGTQEPTRLVAQNIPQQAQAPVCKPNQELDKQIANLANQLAEKTAEISRQNQDIEALKQEKKELEKQLVKSTIVTAAEYAQEPVMLQKRLNDQAKLLLPFTVNIELEAKGQFVPIIVRVDPANKRVTVTVDEVAARRLSEA